MHNIEFDVAEVLDYEYTYTYRSPSFVDSNVNKLFALKVRSCGSYFNKQPFLARPSNMNIKNIPLVGEYVLIYKSFSQKSNSENWKDTIWYYLDTIDLKSSMNANILPGISAQNINQEEIDNTKPGKTFQLKSISPLQPYEGDIIIEGRNGNSIRFSNTINTGGDYYLSPTWSGNTSTELTVSDPIIILSNRKNNRSGREFVVENVNTDDSSLYLTSTQQINIQLGSNTQKNPLSCFLPSETQYNASQLIGVADRVILKAKTDIAIIDSPRGIVLNTTGDVKIGSDDATDSMVHGDVLLSILNKIINQLQMPILVKGNDGEFADGGNQVSAAQQQLKDLLSSTYFIKKNTY